MRRPRGFDARIHLVVLALLPVGGCRHGSGAAPPAPSSPRPAGMVRYFFVVPQDLPDGTSSEPQRKALEAWLVQQAGGYTRLGPCRGGWQNGRDLIEEDSIAYFVVGPDGLRSQIEQRIVRQFKQRQALVVQW